MPLWTTPREMRSSSSGAGALPSDSRGERAGTALQQASLHHRTVSHPPPTSTIEVEEEQEEEQAIASSETPRRDTDEDNIKSPSSCCCGRCRRRSRLCLFTFILSLLLLLGGLATAGYFLFPRTNIKVELLSSRQAVQHHQAGKSVLPVFALAIRAEVSVSNPNYVPFSLENIHIDVRYEPPPSGSGSGGTTVSAADASDSNLIVTLRAPEAARVTIPAGSPSNPSFHTFLVFSELSTNDGASGLVTMAPALACARDLYGDVGMCRLIANVHVQPVYLGLGEGIVPSQTFDLPMDIKLPPPATAAKRNRRRVEEDEVQEVNVEEEVAQQSYSQEKREKETRFSHQKSARTPYYRRAESRRTTAPPPRDEISVSSSSSAVDLDEDDDEDDNLLPPSPSSFFMRSRGDRQAPLPRNHPCRWGIYNCL